jgi:prepilin-type N-terminal cleavage/methylation domain-containing protein
MSFRRRGFTLVEMLLATVLAGLLMAGVLFMTAAVGRDRRRVAADEAGPRRSGVMEQVRWDLVNAVTMSPQGSGRILVLVGHAGLDPQTLAPTNRLTRVVYEVRGRGRHAALFRQQEYLDEPTRPDRWTELVCADVQAINVADESGDGQPVEREKPAEKLAPGDELVPGITLQQTRRGPMVYFVPTRARVRVQHGMRLMDEEMWLR